MAQSIDDESKDNRVVIYYTEYERKLIDAKRELTGETAAQYSRRIVRLHLKGMLIDKTSNS